MEAGEAFKQTGFELHAAPSEDPTQPELSSYDTSQPDAGDSEPVFWPTGAAQDSTFDDGVQPDALEWNFDSPVDDECAGGLSRTVTVWNENSLRSANSASNLGGARREFWNHERTRVLQPLSPSP